MLRLIDHAHIQTGALFRSSEAAIAGEVVYVRVAAISEGVILPDWMHPGPYPTKGFNAALRKGDILVRAKADRLVAAPVDYELVGAFPTIDAFLVRPLPGIPPFFLVAVINAAGPIAATSAKPTVADIANLPIPELPPDRQRIVAELAGAVARERSLLARRVALAEVAGRERIARALAAATDPSGTPQPEGGTLRSKSRPAHHSRRLINIRPTKKALNL